MTALDLPLPPAPEGSADVAARVATARNAQSDRYTTLGAGGRALNVDASGDELMRVATPDESGQALIADAAVKLALSARAYHRVLKVARTIADLEGSLSVKRVHVAEALSYRRRAPSDTMATSPNALAN